MRSKPKLGNEFKMGQVFNGAIGEITGGPVNADNHIWWQIIWDPNKGRHRWNPPFDKICKDGVCKVWSAQFVKEVKGPVLIRK